MGRVWSLLAALVLSFHLSRSDDATDSVNTRSTFIVGVQNDMKPSAFSDVQQWYKATLTSVTSNPLKDSESTKSPDFLHVYTTVFHGFSAQLTPKQAQQLRKRPGVLTVLPDNLRQLHTTRSPEFLGLTSSVNPSGLLSQSDSGSNVIIGIMDTGIWPERRSFDDKGLGPVPSHWKGQCTEGEQFTAAHCNKKIIGARYFSVGYEARRGFINSSEEIRSTRDSDGHGTHTASTAAGRSVANASLFGYASGVAVGVAPKARIAAYKICWKNGCMDSDILSAFDKAVEDGVNIISISVGGGAIPYNLDPIAIGSFSAVERGILVSISAGNDGPSKMTVTNVAPWLTTVGASTIDRKFPADLLLEDGLIIKGTSLYSGDPLPEKYIPLIYAGNASASLKIGGRQVANFLGATCNVDSLDENLVRGKIVVCDRGGSPRVQKGEVVKKAGGAAVVVANVAPIGEGLVADSHLIPGLGITESAGHTLRHYMNSNPNPKARIVFHGTELRARPAPVVASFSARGPNVESPYVLKPDVIAPGVNILAAWPDGVAPSELRSDPRRTAFNIASGTSMSCPHVSGAAALLKGAHLDWSPAMIRSALMTTAYTQDNEGKPLLDEKSYNVSTVWDMGAGHVNPEKALDPGLVYDITADDYIKFLCASNVSQEDIRRAARRSVSCGKRSNPWDLNYPAISVVFNEAEKSVLDVAVTRTATHVSDGNARYEVVVTSTKGVTMTVDPVTLEFNTKGEKRSYVVRIEAEKLGVNPGHSVIEVGKIAWADGRHQVVSPVVVLWRDGF